MAGIENIPLVREVKCLWKTELSKSEKKEFERRRITNENKYCPNCIGYKKDCPDYIKRVIHYIK